MILACCEKIAFSALNLKVLHEPGQREVARWKMLQLLEFVTGIDMEELVCENRSTHCHAMSMSDRNEARGRRGRDLHLESFLAAFCLMHDVYTLMNSKGHMVISKLGVTECFDTRLDAQRADGKVTIDIHLDFFRTASPLPRARTEGNPILFVFLRRLHRRLLREGF